MAGLIDTATSPGSESGKAMRALQLALSPGGTGRRQPVRPALVLLIWICAGNHTQAQSSPDQVVLQGSTTSSRVTLQCEILEYTGQAIRLRTVTTKTERSFPASQVVTVKTPRMPSHERGLADLGKANYAKAKEELTQALTDEARRWVRREIMADLIRCHLRQNDFAAAGEQFRKLYKTDQTTRHIRLIPMVWDEVSLSPESKLTAASWLQDKEAVMRLIGASLLLTDLQYGEAAKDVLQALSREPGTRLRVLAGWQEWRLKQKANDISDLEIARHEKLVEELEKDLRPGAWYLVGQAHLLRQEFDLAAAAFLRLPLSHNTDHPVTSQAMFNAARALEQIGFRSQATQIDKEVVDRYPWSKAAKLSEQALQRPVAKPPSG